MQKLRNESVYSSPSLQKIRFQSIRLVVLLFPYWCFELDLIAFHSHLTTLRENHIRTLSCQTLVLGLGFLDFPLMNIVTSRFRWKRSSSREYRGDASVVFHSSDGMEVDGNKPWVFLTYFLIISYFTVPLSDEERPAHLRTIRSRDEWLRPEEKTWGERGVSEVQWRLLFSFFTPNLSSSLIIYSLSVAIFLTTSFGALAVLHIVTKPPHFSAVKQISDPSSSCLCWNGGRKTLNGTYQIIDGSKYKIQTPLAKFMRGKLRR